MMVAHGYPLVGRAGELAQITKARADGCPAVVVQGPSGVGKSRLAREFLRVVESDQVVFDWIQGSRSGADVALGAFASLIPAEVRSDDTFELMQRAIESLRRRGRGRALVLGVDDAQWLDPTSAALVLQLAVSGTAFIVATVRSDEQCPDAVVSLWKDAGGQRIDLGLLRPSEIEALVEAIVGGPVARTTLHWVSQASAGNALYARELVLGAFAGGDSDQVSGLWRLPVRPSVSASLAELVGARMAGLTGQEREALEFLAIGEPLRLSEMLGLVGSGALISVETLGLVGMTGSSLSAEVRLSHPLYAEVIRGTLPSLRARQLRLTLVETVQAREVPAPDDTLRLTRWLLEAEETMPIDLMLAAAKSANLAGDHALGADLAERALRLIGAEHSPDRRFEAMLLLARAHVGLGRLAQAETVLAAAEGSVTTQEAAIDYLEQQSAVLHWGVRRPADLRDLLVRASQWWPGPEWQLRLEPFRLRVASFERLGGGDADATERLARIDVNEVREQVEPVHVANLLYSGRTREASELAQRIRPTSLPLRSLSEAIALSLWSRIRLETGEDWPDLDQSFTRLLEEAVRLGDHAAAGQAAYSLGCLRVLAGRFLDARAMLAEAELQLENRDPVGLLLVTTAMQVDVACFLDDRTAIGPALEECHARLGVAGPLAHQLPYVVSAQAWAANTEGNPPAAQRLLLDAAKEMSSPVHAARLTYEAMRVGAPARTLTKALDTLRDQCDARLVHVYAAHAAACAAAHGPTLLQVADEMADIGASRYGSEAAAHAADAFAAEGRDASARSAAARSRELHAESQGGRIPTISALDSAGLSLTPREEQLTRLAADGLSNIEIADRLVVSVRTVESHLYRAMQKLGVSDRRELRR